MSIYNFTWKIHEIETRKKNIIRVFLLFLFYTLSWFIRLTLLLVGLKFKLD